MGNFLTRGLAAVGLWANEAPDQALDPLAPAFWGQFGAMLDTAGQRVDSESVLQLDVVAAVTSRLGGTMGALPMQVFERTGPKTRRPAPEHPLSKLLCGSPSPGVTSALFRDEQERHLSTWRNCYSRILPDPETGAPIGTLEMIHPGRLQRIQRVGARRYYTFTRLPPATGTDTWSDDEIWHIKRAPLTADGLMGRPVWETSRKVFAYAQAVDEFGSLYFKNGGSGGGVIKHPGNFRSADEREAFLDGWRSGGTGLNRHKDRLLLYGLEYAPFQVNNNEAQFIETQRQAAQKVCRVFDMPPHMAGILDNATFSNIEQQSIEFVVYTLAPHVAAWDRSASEELLIGPDKDRYFVETNVSSLLRGNLKDRYTAYGIARQWGWASADDIREQDDQDPLPDGQGNVYLVPMNMSPAGQIGADGTAKGEEPDADDTQDPRK